MHRFPSDTIHPASFKGGSQSIESSIHSKDAQKTLVFLILLPSSTAKYMICFAQKFQIDEVEKYTKNTSSASWVQLGVCTRTHPSVLCPLGLLIALQATRAPTWVILTYWAHQHQSSLDLGRWQVMQWQARRQRKFFQDAQTSPFNYLHSFAIRTEVFGTQCKSFSRGSGLSASVNDNVESSSWLGYIYWGQAHLFTGATRLCLLI